MKRVRNLGSRGGSAVGWWLGFVVAFVLALYVGAWVVERGE